MVKKYLDKRTVEWRTKCAKVGHSWWHCEEKVVRYTICAGVGHTGWQHRCGRCNV